MSSRRMRFVTLATQPTLATGTPVRISSTDLWVRSAVIQSKDGNAANVYVGNSQANAVVNKGYEIQEGLCFPMQGDNQAGTSGLFNLKEVWVGGATGDVVTVQYFEDIPQ